MMIVFEGFGWVGAGILLFAYYLSINKKDKTAAFPLPLLNLIGSILLLCNAIYFTVYPFVLVNAFWAIISIREWVKLGRASKEKV